MSEHTASAAHGGGHVLAPRTLIGTAAALGVLTVVTVAASQVDLGRLNIVIALGIASAKATLVALYFMHLRWGARFHLVVLAGAVVFAVLLTSFVVFDSRSAAAESAALRSGSARRVADLADPAGGRGPTTPPPRTSSPPAPRRRAGRPGRRTASRAGS